VRRVATSADGGGADGGSCGEEGSSSIVLIRSLFLLEFQSIKSDDVDNAR